MRDLEFGGVALSDVVELLGGCAEVREWDEDGGVSVAFGFLGSFGGEVEGEIPAAKVELEAEAVGAGRRGEGGGGGDGSDLNVGLLGYTGGDRGELVGCGALGGQGGLFPEEEFAGEGEADGVPGEGAIQGVVVLGELGGLGSDELLEAVGVEVGDGGLGGERGEDEVIGEGPCWPNAREGGC